MRGNIDVKKFLEELKVNRDSIDNDRKSYEKVRLEIAQVVDKLTKIDEQWNNYCKKLMELNKTVSNRNSDVGILKLKIQILSSSYNKLELNVEKCQVNLRAVKKELAGVSSLILEQNSAFAKKWNCAKSGVEYRRTQQAEKISELSDLKKNLEYELDDFLLMKRSVEYAEAEKRDIQMEFEKHRVQADTMDSNTRDEIEKADTTLLKLQSKRKELPGRDSWGQEFTRTTEEIENTRKSITFLEGRVSATQRALEAKRQDALASNAISEFGGIIGYNAFQSSEKYQPSNKVRIVSEFTDPESDFNNSRASNIPFNTSGEKNYGASSKPPRMFQFKKKPSTTAAEYFVSNNESNKRQETPSGTGGFENTRVIFLSSNSGSK